MVEYFLSNSEFGDLIIRDILAQYDYPRVFVCENILGHKFLFSESLSEEKLDEWIVTPLSNGKYYRLVTNQLDLRSALLKSEDGNFYLVRRNYESDVTTTSIAKEPFASKITNYKVYVGVAKPTGQYEVDTHGIVESANLLGTPLLDLVLFPENHEIKDIDSSFLEETCGSMRKLFKNFNSGKGLRVTTLQGSFVVRFNLNDPTNLFYVSDGEKAIIKIHSILSKKESYDVYRDLNGDVDSVVRYKKVLETLSKVGNDIRIISASPSSATPTIQCVKNSFVSESIKNINHFFKEKIEEVSISGCLKSFDEPHKKFVLLSKYGESIKGEYLDSAYPNGFEYTIDKVYNCKIDKISKLGPELGENEKGYPHYILKKAEQD